MGLVWVLRCNCIHNNVAKICGGSQCVADALLVKRMNRIS